MPYRTGASVLSGGSCRLLPEVSMAPLGGPCSGEKANMIQSPHYPLGEQA
jgi:hypothetical protein